MADKKVQRKLIADEDQFERQAGRREAIREIRDRPRRKVSWDAVGMPPPGPDFVRVATAMGDTPDVVVRYEVNPETGKRRKVKASSFTGNLQDLYDAALTTPKFAMHVELKPGKTKEVLFVPGHLWAAGREEFVNLMDPASQSFGPAPADVMIIGKMPGAKEEQEGRNLMGASGQLLLEMFNDLNITNIGKWYITNICKFQPPDGSTRIKSGWMKDCMPLLEQELRIVRPKYILCLGADASKCLLGKKASVASMEGRVAELSFPINPEQCEPGNIVEHKALVMTAVHPAQVMRDESDRRRLERALSRFFLLTEGVRWDLDSDETDFRSIYDYQTLEDYLVEIEEDPRKEDNWIGTDAEWHGEHAVNEGSYIRTFQFSHFHNCGGAVVLHDNEGEPCFIDKDGQTGHEDAVKLLLAFYRGESYELLDGTVYQFREKRLIGHFFNADLEWLQSIGLDLQPQFSVPLYPEPFDDQPEFIQQELSRPGLEFGPGDDIPPFILTMWRGGIDTGLAAHAIEEATQYSLEMLTTRYTTVPRYDVPLKEWLQSYCAQRGIKLAHLEGYGPVPDDILIPYGIYDASGTLDLAYALEPKLEEDYRGNNCREAFWESMIAAPSILDIHTNGICVDKVALDYLTEVFVGAKNNLEEEIRAKAKWPEFNIRSVFHVREYLFGERFNGKIDKLTGDTVRIRPEGAVSLKLTPFLDTSKPPKRWEDICADGKEDEHTPGTAKEILKVLAQDNLQQSPSINRIRDHRFLDQALKSVLREPISDDDGNWLDEASAGSLGEIDLSYTSYGGGLGGLIYDRGLAATICSDGRVRTHMYQTKETGRWSSARPPLQIFSKKRESDYKRIIGDAYDRKLREVLVPSPGHVMIEADFIGAELLGMAVMSGDTAMLDHCFRNQLPEDHPEYYDIHSAVAKLAFGLNCLPTKAGLASIGKLPIRTVAKAVVFGIAYGRGAKAIALAVREEDVFITVAEAQAVIDAVFKMYPKLLPFFENAKLRATKERWIQNCFGRYRRFPWVNPNDFGMVGEVERQAMNFPIQSLVASAMSRAMAYTCDYNKRVEPGLFKILLQIHDAILIECKFEHISHIVDNVLPLTMQQMVPIFPATLDGFPVNRGPYRLGLAVEVLENFGKHLTKETAAKYGVPEFSPGGVKLVG